MPLLRRLLPLAACLAATPLAAQTLRGKVVDAATGAGVPAVAVRALSEGHDVGHARTAADGTFSFALRVPGTVRIEAQRTGYRTTVTGDLPVGVRETVDVEVRLSAEAIAIEPLRVTARAEPPRRRALEQNGFYDRERQGVGKYLRREDFENRGNTNLAQVLSRVQGTAIYYSGSSQYIYFPRSGSPDAARLSASPRPPEKGTGAAPAKWGPPNNACLPRLFVDGVRVSYDAQSDINSVVDPDQVEAIEVFRGPSEIPVQYNDNNSQCGVILIWTRKEP
ncbi:MAG: carboxypeptidase regulatory-like domain-containing protein [Longimicrobiaceae bacterium]